MIHESFDSYKTIMQIKLRSDKEHFMHISDSNFLTC